MKRSVSSWIRPALLLTALLPAENEKPSKESILNDRIILEKVNKIILTGDATDLETTPGSDALVEVSHLQIPGDSSKLLAKLSEKYIGKPLTQKKLTEIRSAIMRHYHHAHHPLVTIDIPKQEITNGTIRFVIIESRLSQIICKGNEWFSCDRLKGYISLKPDEAIDSDTILNDIAWMNRNPFRLTQVVFAPGGSEKTTNLELITEDRRPFRIYGGMDNTGNTATHEGRWFAGFNWGNAFSLDQLLTYQYTAAFQINSFQAHTIHYVAPLPWRNQFIVYGGYSKAIPDISGFDSEGHSGQVSLRYVVPLVAAYRNWIKEMHIGFDYKNTNNNFEFSDFDLPPIVAKNVNISQFLLQFNFGCAGKPHEFSSSWQYFLSPGEMLPNESHKNYEDLRYKASAHYYYMRGMASYTYTIENTLSLYTQVRGQYANRNLLPSEQFGLGGYDTVRGYGEREVNADRAFCWNFEIRSPKLSFFDYFWKLDIHDEATLLAFCDYGWGSNHNLLPGEDGSQNLVGIGPGLRYAIMPYFSLRADVAFRFTKTQFSDGPFARLHIGVMANY